MCSGHQWVLATPVFERRLRRDGPGVSAWGNIGAIEDQDAKHPSFGQNRRGSIDTTCSGSSTSTFEPSLVSGHDSTTEPSTPRSSEHTLDVDDGTSSESVGTAKGGVLLRDAGFAGKRLPYFIGVADGDANIIEVAAKMVEAIDTLFDAATPTRTWVYPAIFYATGGATTAWRSRVRVELNRWNMNEGLAALKLAQEILMKIYQASGSQIKLRQLLEMLHVVVRDYPGDMLRAGDDLSSTNPALDHELTVRGKDKKTLTDFDAVKKWAVGKTAWKLDSDALKEWAKRRTNETVTPNAATSISKIREMLEQGSRTELFPADQ